MADIKLGLLVNGSPANRQSATQHLVGTIEAARAARDAGFDLVVMGQHFLSADYRYLQPVPMLSRLVPETGDMALATGILLLPLLQPVEAAEQLATLDVLSGGRLVVGVGLGFREEEFHAFGVEKSDRLARQTEALALMEKLWTGEPFEHAGRFFRVTSPGSGLVPQQSPRPPIWVAAMNERAFGRVVSHGHVPYLGPRLPTADVPRLLESAPSVRRLAIRRELYVDTAATVLEDAQHHIGVRSAHHDRGWGFAQDAGVAEAEPLESFAIVGTPESCAAQLSALRDSVGDREIHVVLRCGWPMLSLERILAMIRLFGDTVRPALGHSR